MSLFLPVDTALNSVKFLTKCYFRFKSEKEKLIYLKGIIIREAQYNLDITAILRLKGLDGRIIERRLLLTCLSTKSTELLDSVGIGLIMLLEGEDETDIANLVEETDKSDFKSTGKSMEYYQKKSSLWLYEFSTLKIRILKTLAEKDESLVKKLRLNARLNNLNLSLRVLIGRLNNKTNYIRPKSLNSGLLWK